MVPNDFLDQRPALFLETKSTPQFSIYIFSFFKYLKSYATIMLQNEKWKFAMEQYYTSRNEPIPWKSQSYEVKFSVPS